MMNRLVESDFVAVDALDLVVFGDCDSVFIEVMLGAYFSWNDIASFQFLGNILFIVVLDTEADLLSGCESVCLTDSYRMRILFRISGNVNILF